MKFKLGIASLILSIVLIYANVWYEHMGIYWSYLWWYSVTAGFGFIANVVALIVFIVTTVFYLSEKFPLE